MKKSLFLKIFLGYFLIALLLLSFILIFSFRTIKAHYIDTLTNHLKNFAIGFSPKVTPLLENKEFQELDDLVKKIGKKVNTRITIILPSGMVVADSEEDPQLMENHRDRPEIMQSKRSEVGTSIRYSRTLEEEMLYVAIPISREGEFIGTLRASLWLKEINNLIGEIKRSIVKIALIVTLISLLGAFLFSKTLSKPMKELAVRVRKVASGDFEQKIFLKNKDEFKELADSFNYMTQKIKTLFADLAYQKEELTSIISSIQGGFLVLDRKEKILLCNDSFKKIIKEENIEGKSYWEVMRQPKLSELIKKTKNEKGNFTEEIELGEKIFLCSTSFINLTQEITLIFHDITEIKNLEKVKKDFVVNISHEMRTPLTAIKGFVETLEEEIDQKHKHYLNIVSNHTDRLINIVQDLLSLSELEEKRVELEIEKLDLKNLLEDVLRIFEQRIREKGLTLKLHINGQLFPIHADSFKLEQMLINLIDNAIKYTDKGEIKISSRIQDEHLKIEIEDTGIGIPKEDLGRIFERFYVIDKSRSRKLGGTGLGLSIVKHIVLLHNGKIDVESTPGIGTKFIITFPTNLS